MTAQFGQAQKIVIVEDNQALSDIYKTRLELLGYTVFAAYDGLQALSVIEDQHPDLVLLDLMVPKKAGDQVLEEMRESDWGKDIKVLIISNLNEADAPKGLRNLGIEGYAVKANLNNDQLDQLVDTILKPAGQTEDVVLAQTARTEVAYAEPSAPPNPAVADPYSGTRMSSTSPARVTPTPTPASMPVLPVAETYAEEPSLPAAEPTQPTPQQAPDNTPTSPSDQAL